MRKALIIGINNYKNANNLCGCINDATAITKSLSFHSDGRLNFTIVQPQQNIETKEGLLSELETLFVGNAETEIALFYFSGHGGVHSNGEGYIVISDGNNDEQISMQDILKYVNSSRCRNQIVILDCCHAGAMGSITSIAVLKEGVTILSASKSDEFSFDEPEHGVFTSLLLKALDGGASDLTGHVTAGGVYAYIDKALGPCGQRPVFKTNTAQFLPLRETEPPVDRRVLRKKSKYFPSSSDNYKLDPSFEFTNVEDSVNRNQEPYAIDANVAIFKDLQTLNRVGLVSPNCDELPSQERHMYFAALESKSFKLTPIGQFYWMLASENKI